ncbi:hypothetical protein [Bacillus suaedaesalsae]|uniref:Uncharacterized protein n=1 Tax=Bacillus suaedaesalsae TaxID=2810349 RepID=A0ABS2DJV1_9BACI|nr:hypothetical protein [Bacillus suaedaesalsae]MBM6618771.1 hypothetical protein [Bacillus suaedaesalsae]
MKRNIVRILMMASISGFLLLIGYIFDIRILMFSYYVETTESIEAGGSLIPFVIGFLCTYLIDKMYDRKQQTN